MCHNEHNTNIEASNDILVREMAIMRDGNVKFALDGLKEITVSELRISGIRCGGDGKHAKLAVKKMRDTSVEPVLARSHQRVGQGILSGFHIPNTTPSVPGHQTA